VAPYLTLMDDDAPQRRYSLREAFNALRWLARAGAPWRLLPNDLPPWQMVYQQFRRGNDAGCFEAMVNDVRSIIRVSGGCPGQPSAVVRRQTGGVHVWVNTFPLYDEVHRWTPGNPIRPRIDAVRKFPYYKGVLSGEPRCLPFMKLPR
jgi:hypothetical protein